MIDQTIKITMLFDAYGELLTERQRKCIEMHYLDDLSLAEIAEHFAVSRQAVHDILKRSVQTMQTFEEKLGLLAAGAKQAQTISEIELLLEQAFAQTEAKALLGKLKEKISSLK